MLIELSPLAVASAPEGLAVYHARVRALAAEVPAAQREAVAAFLAAAADAAATAAAELSADRRSQPDVSRAAPLRAGGVSRTGRTGWLVLQAGRGKREPAQRLEVRC